jgi:hypothetical protein
MRELAEDGYRLRSPGSAKNAVPGGLKDFAGDFADEELIFHQEDGCRSVCAIASLHRGLLLKPKLMAALIQNRRLRLFGNL